MKTLTAVLMAFLLVLNSTHFYSQTNTFKLGFTGAYPNYFGPVSNNPNYQVNWDWYDEFKMNTWSGWWVGDTAAFVFNKLKENNMEGLFQPDTLRWAAYGRMQVNEAEYEDTLRFSYGGHRCGSNYQDNTQFGNSQWVRYFNKNDQCNVEQSPEGLVLWNVKENGFQSFCSFPYDPVYQVPFPRNGPNGSDTKYLNTYYIKPRMRIDSAEAFSDPPKNVCKIIVKAYNGDIVNQTIIRTDMFREASSYRGQYLENFTLPISVSADILNTGRPNSDPLSNLNNCQVDYQVYWYGTVSVWIDYVKVMDEAANKLFTNQTLRDRLQDKITRFKDYEQANGEIIQGFYMEEIDYSNLACIKYLNEVLLPQWSGNDPRYKMIGLIAPWSFRTILKNKKTTDYADYF